MFLQSNELFIKENGIAEWKESVRWFKGEEDFKKSCHKCSHMEILSFPSMMNLRQCFEAGSIIMDLKERALPRMITRIIENMMEENLIKREDKNIIMRFLLFGYPTAEERRRNHIFNESMQLRANSPVSLKN